MSRKRYSGWLRRTALFSEIVLAPMRRRIAASPCRERDAVRADAPGAESDVVASLMFFGTPHGLCSWVRSLSAHWNVAMMHPFVIPAHCPCDGSVG